MTILPSLCLWLYQPATVPGLAWMMVPGQWHGCGCVSGFGPSVQHCLGLPVTEVLAHQSVVYTVPWREYLPLLYIWIISLVAAVTEAATTTILLRACETLAGCRQEEARDGGWTLGELILDTLVGLAGLLASRT